MMAGVILKSIFLPEDNGTGDPDVEGMRSDRGGVLGVHFAVDSPSNGVVWGNAFLSASAIMLFISRLKGTPVNFSTEQWDEPYLATGPIGFHTEDCFEDVLLIADNSGRAGGDEETPSIANTSSEKLLDIDIGTAPSVVDLRRAASERSLIGWVRTIN